MENTEIDLSEDEIDFLKRDPFEILDDEVNELKRILPKIRKDDPLLVNALAMDAELFSRNMLLPHYEKANRWVKAANTAKRLERNCSVWWFNAARNCQMNADYPNAGKYFELAANEAKKEGIENHLVLNLYRQAKANYANIGDIDGAHRTHVAEFDLRRESSELPTKTMMSVYRLTSMYGESPLRVAISAFVVIFLCSLVYWTEGLVSQGLVLNVMSVDSFTTSLYFSFVTFTTLGYGDYAPQLGVSRVVASFEAVCGLVLTSLFLVTFVRRYSR